MISRNQPKQFNQQTQNLNIHTIPQNHNVHLHSTLLVRQSPRLSSPWDFINGREGSSKHLFYQGIVWRNMEMNSNQCLARQWDCGSRRLSQDYGATYQHVPFWRETEGVFRCTEIVVGLFCVDYAFVLGRNILCSNVKMVSAGKEERHRRLDFSIVFEQ